MEHLGDSWSYFFKLLGDIGGSWSYYFKLLGDIEGSWSYFFLAPWRHWRLLETLEAPGTTFLKLLQDIKNSDRSSHLF